MQRNYTFDYLKVIALLCIVLAHVNPPAFIFQIRNFDVPLMIIISVWLSMRAIKRDNFNYKSYVLKRTKRLIIPTWIFLTIYFGLKILLDAPLSIREVIGSYLLIDGIGYVWVIRIYIYIALLTPPILKGIQEWSIKKIIMYSGISYICYEIFYFLTKDTSGVLRKIIECFGWDIIGYTFIIIFGLITHKMKNKELLKISFTFGVIFIVCAFILDLGSTQQFKYPVRLYYLSYAFFVGMVLKIVVNYLYQYNKLPDSKLVLFISQNSMWIYLWHILTLPLINILFIDNSLGFIIRLILVMILSILITLIQNITRFKIKYVKEKFVLAIQN